MVQPAQWLAYPALTPMTATKYSSVASPESAVIITVRFPIQVYALSNEPKNDRRTLHLSPPKGSQKRKTADLRKNRTSLAESLLQNFFV